MEKNLNIYPYLVGVDDNEEYLSEKACSRIIKIRKKMVKITKQVLFYGPQIVGLGNGLTPIQAINLPILQSTQILKTTDLNSRLLKKAIVIQVMKEIPPKMDLTKMEIETLYDLSIECLDKSIGKEELITKVINLRGGWSLEIVAVIGFIILMIIEGFAPRSAQLHLPPNLEWLAGHQRPGNHFGYGSSEGVTLRNIRNTIVTGATQTAGSDKNQPSPGSWDYKDVVTRLNKEIHKKKFDFQIGDETYTFQNFQPKNSSELIDELADKIYNSIRDCDTDICDIAEKLGFKAETIKRVKDHIFYNKHHLDKYVKFEPLKPVKYARFDPDLYQALAWKRFETGTYTQKDVTWLKHEAVEARYELKHGSGYLEAHTYAQSRFDGMPWNEKL